MKAKPQPPGNDPDWVRLLDAERRLQAEIVAAQVDARDRVDQARAGAARAVPDPAALATLAAQQQQDDTTRQRSELERLARDADATVRALARAPEPIIDTLARTALLAPTLVRDAAARGLLPGQFEPAAGVAAQAFERLLEVLLATAPEEFAIRRLGRELAHTVRLVNVLEQRLAVDLTRTRIRVRRTLDEREREEALRLRRLTAHTR